MGHIEAFNSMAATYDTPDRIQMAKHSAATVRRLLNQKVSRTAIDFGCGTGLLSLELSNTFESILMIDSSSEMIKEVKKKLKKAPLSHLTAKHLDIETDRVLPETVDTIFMSLVLHHIAEPEDILSKLSDAIHLGGQLMIIEMERSDNSSHHHSSLSKAELMRKLDKQNFVNIQSEYFYETIDENSGDSFKLYIVTAEKV